MNTLHIETVARYRALAEAQLRVADWEDAGGDEEAIASYDAALTAIQRAIEAMPADGSLKREKFEEIQAPLFLVRARILDRRALAERHRAPRPQEIPWPRQHDSAENDVVSTNTYVRRLRWWTRALLGEYLTAVVFLLGALQIAQEAPRSQWPALSGLTGAILAAFAGITVLVLRGWRRAAQPTGSGAGTGPVSP